MRVRVRAILLDFDGTLVDSEPLHYEAWSAAVAEFDAGTDWDDYQRRFVGQTDRWAGATFLAEAGHEPNGELVDQVRHAKHAYYRERARERLRIGDPVREYLREAPSRLGIGVVSSSPEADVLPTLERAELLTRLSAVVCGNHVLRHKPHPEPYMTALERFGLPAAECVAFEDSASGVAAAEAAGLRVIKVPHPDALLSLIERSVG